MKQAILATALILAATAASATEITAVGGRAFGPEVNTAGVTVGEKFGPVKVEGSFERTTNKGEKANVFGVTAGLPVGSLGPVAFTAKAGVSYLDANYGYHGYGARVGLEGAYSLTKNVSLVGEVGYLRTEAQIRAAGGNVARVGVRYSF